METLNEALRRMGYTTRSRPSRKKDILKEGKVVLEAVNAEEAWGWLQENGYQAPPVPPVMVFLQNAWSPLYAGGTWPRPSWLRALIGSRSGKRLTLLGLDWECYQNTTPIVGALAKSVVEPNPVHIAALLESPGLAIVVACGRQAEAALKGVWAGPLLAMPHPASRVVTNALYESAAKLIHSGFSERMALRQKRGRIVKEKIGG